MTSDIANNVPQQDTEKDVTLLVVEDNDLDVELLRFHLRRMGSSVPVARAHHGEEALAILQQAHNGTQPSSRYTVLLDLNMPRMSGFEFLEAIHAEPWFKQLDIYVCTTSDQASDRSQAARFDVRDYFLKPVTQTILTRVLN